MVAVTAYRNVLADAARPGYFPAAQLELAYFGLGDALRGQRHYDEAAQSFEEAASAHNVGPELKIRALLAAGECRDSIGERQRASPTTRRPSTPAPTPRAPTPRESISEPPTKETEWPGMPFGKVGTAAPAFPYD